MQSKLMQSSWDWSQCFCLLIQINMRCMLAWILNWCSWSPNEAFDRKLSEIVRNLWNSYKIKYVKFEREGHHKGKLVRAGSHATEQGINLPFSVNLGHLTVLYFHLPTSVSDYYDHQFHFEGHVWISINNYPRSIPQNSESLSEKR